MIKFKASREDRIATLLMLVVPIILITIFVLYPLFEMFISTFKSSNGFSIEAYRDVLFSESFKASFLHSVVTGICTAVLSLVLSVPSALAINYTKNRFFKYLYTVIVLSAIITPPFVSSIAYIELYGRRGLITYTLLGLRTNPYNASGIVLMQSITFAPFNVVFLLGALKEINPTIIKSARDLGANGKHILVDIILKDISRTILSLLFLTFVRSIADYGTPIIIGGRYNTVASDIYMQLVGYSNLQKVSVMNLTLLVPSLIAFFFYMRCDKRLTKDRGILNITSNVNFLLKKSGLLGVFSYFVSTIYVIIIGLQYFAILLLSITKHTKNGYIFTLEHINRFITYNSTVFLRSIVYSLIVSFLGTFLALLLSFYLSRKGNRIKSIVEVIIMLPYTIAGISFGIGYIMAFNHKPIYLVGTASIVISNMIFKQFPVTYRIINDYISRIPISIDNAAKDLGASNLRVFFSHILPLMKKSFFTSFAYNFSSSMTTAGAILFLINPSKLLQVFKLFDAIYVGDYGVAAVMSEAIIIVVLLSEMIFSILMRIKIGDKRVFRS